jgi:hypothetical protein
MGFRSSLRNPISIFRGLRQPAGAPAHYAVLACFCRPVSGRPAPSNESSDVPWVLAAEIGTYEMDRAMRKRIERYLSICP